ncbi:MAG: tetratricopeptide repeat protein, partial [Endomicrobiia bacterium]
TFYSTAYFCFAEGRRKDIELHDRGGLVFKNIYGNDFRSLTREEKEIRKREIELSIVKTGKPVFYSTFNKNILPEATLYENGILYEVNKKSYDSWYLYSLLRGSFSNYSDYRSRALAPVYVFMRSRTLDEEKKLKWLDYSISQWKDVTWLVSNLKFELHSIAYKVFNENKIDTAEKYYKKIIKIDPYDINALLNLGVIAERKNNLDEAKRIYLDAIKLQPKNPTAYYNLGVVYWREQNWEKVIENFKKVIELDPSHSEAKKYLQILSNKLK